MPSKNPKQSSGKGRGPEQEKQSSTGPGSTEPARMPRYDDRPDAGKQSGSSERSPGVPSYGDTEPGDPRRPRGNEPSGGREKEPSQGQPQTESDDEPEEL